MKFKQSTPLNQIIKPKTFPDVVVLFCFQYGYNYKHLSNEINMPIQTFSRKLNNNTFTALEQINISDFIRSKYGYSNDKKIRQV